MTASERAALEALLTEWDDAAKVQAALGWSAAPTVLRECSASLRALLSSPPPAEDAEPSARSERAAREAAEARLVEVERRSEEWRSLHRVAVKRAEDVFQLAIAAKEPVVAALRAMREWHRVAPDEGRR